MLTHMHMVMYTWCLAHVSNGGEVWKWKGEETGTGLCLVLGPDYAREHGPDGIVASGRGWGGSGLCIFEGLDPQSGLSSVAAWTRGNVWWSRLCSGLVRMGDPDSVQMEKTPLGTRSRWKNPLGELTGLVWTLLVVGPYQHYLRTVQMLQFTRG